MIKLSESTLALLADIENRIDPEIEEDFLQQWRTFLDHEFMGEIFTAKRKKTTPTNHVYQNISINDAILDYEKMLVMQLELVSRALMSDNQHLCVRSNYGTGIMTSLFGAKVFTMPFEMDTLPTTYTLDNPERIREIAEDGIPDLMGGFGRQVFELGEIYKEVFADYPKIQKYVSVYHPDTQGPLDVCELLWGGEMFYAMYDEPELVHKLLKVITDTYVAFLEKWYSIIPRKSDYNVHWSNLMHKGTILLRDDSAMNLSPVLYAEFAKPYDAYLLEYFDGGAIHFCGRGDHYIEEMCKIPKLSGIQLSQPHLNDMEHVYQNTVDKGIPLLAFSAEWAEKDKGRPGCYQGNLST